MVTDAEFFSKLTQTSDGGYILGGTSQSEIFGNKTQASKGGQDFWIVKLGLDTLSINDAETNFNLSIFPNPNQGKFKIQVSNLNSPNTEVTITDVLGRRIWHKEFQIPNNQLSEEINLPNAKGIYLLQLKTGNQIFSRKVIVE